MHSLSAAGCKTARGLGLRCFEEMTSGMGSGETRPRDERNGDGPWRKCGKRPDEKRDSAASGGSTFKRRPPPSTISLHNLISSHRQPTSPRGQNCPSSSRAGRTLLSRMVQMTDHCSLAAKKGELWGRVYREAIFALILARGHVHTQSIYLLSNECGAGGYFRTSGRHDMVTLEYTFSCPSSAVRSC